MHNFKFSNIQRQGSDSREIIENVKVMINIGHINSILISIFKILDEYLPPTNAVYQWVV